MCERKCILILTARRKTWPPSSCLTLRTRVTYEKHTIHVIKRTVHRIQRPYCNDEKRKCKSSHRKTNHLAQCNVIQCARCTFSSPVGSNTHIWCRVYMCLSFYFPYILWPVDSLIYLFSPQIIWTDACMRKTDNLLFVVWHSYEYTYAGRFVHYNIGNYTSIYYICSYYSTYSICTQWDVFIIKNIVRLLSVVVGLNKQKKKELKIRARSF